MGPLHRLSNDPALLQVIWGATFNAIEVAKTLAHRGRTVQEVAK